MFAHVVNTRTVWAWVVITPFERPVVPDVNRMSLMSVGNTDAARSRAASGATDSPLARKSDHDVVPSTGPPRSRTIGGNGRPSASSRSMVT